MVQKFLYVTLGVLSLAAAYNLGAPRTQAQGRTDFVSVSVREDNSDLTGAYALTASGDLYQFIPNQFSYVGNFVSGPPIATEQETWGTIKGKFRSQK